MRRTFNRPMLIRSDPLNPQFLLYLWAVATSSPCLNLRSPAVAAFLWLGIQRSERVHCCRLGGNISEAGLRLHSKFI